MIARLTGATLRAVLLMLVIATPTVLLADPLADNKQLVALVALFMAAVTFAGYNSVYPGLVEFRDAPPFKRIRFLMLFATVFCLSAIERGRVHPSTLSELIHTVGALIGLSMDFPYSPVRLATLMVAADATEAQVGAVRAAAGMSHLILLISLDTFVIMMRLVGWPRRDRAFSVWVNLPTFDPTSNGDVVARLSRDTRWNIALGSFFALHYPRRGRGGRNRLATLGPDLAANADLDDDRLGLPSGQPVHARHCDGSGGRDDSGAQASQRHDRNRQPIRVGLKWASST